MEAQKAPKNGFCISFCPDIGDMSTTLLCQEPLDSADTEKGPEKAEARVSMVFHLFSMELFEHICSMYLSRRKKKCVDCGHAHVEPTPGF